MVYVINASNLTCRAEMPQGKNLLTSILHEPSLLFPNPQQAKIAVLRKLIEESNITYLRGLRCEDAVEKTLVTDPLCVQSLRLFDSHGSRVQAQVHADIKKIKSPRDTCDLTDAVISRIVDDVDPLCGHPSRRGIEAGARCIANSQEVAVRLAGLLPLSKFAVFVYRATLQEVSASELNDLMSKYVGRFGVLSRDSAAKMLCRAVAEGCGIKPATIENIAENMFGGVEILTCCEDS